MEFIFLNAAWVTQFTRSDAEDAHWIMQEMNLSATFPFLPEKKIEHGMRVAFRDPADNVIKLFEIKIVTNNNPDGYQQITAEDIVISELTDEHINSQKLTGKTAAEALTTALTGTLWSVGTNTASGTQNADFSRGSVWDAVNTIQQNWNVYITPRVTISAAGVITGKYLDIAPAEGAWRGLRLSIRKNMLDPAVTYDEDGLYTALYGYGGTVDKARTGQDDEPTELTFADVVWSQTAEHPAKPSGQTYLEWPEKTALYGRNGRPRFGYFQNGNIKDANLLLEKTWESLKLCSDPKISISGGVVDLHRLGYADQPIRLHDMAIVDVEETGEHFYKQIICADIDLLDESGDRVEIGAYIPNIIYINRDTAKKSGGGGGGGRSPGSLTELEESITYYDSEFVKDSQLIGMVVGLKNGNGYIKAASIAASINADGGTNIHLSADVIDIDGVVTKLLTKEISCKNIHTTTGANLFEGKCSFPDEVVISTQLTLFNHDADWMTASIPSFTYSQAHNFVYRLNGVDYTTNGYIIGTRSSTTIHYLGYSDS